MNRLSYNEKYHIKEKYLHFFFLWIRLHAYSVLYSSTYSLFIFSTRGKKKLHKFVDLYLGGRWNKKVWKNTPGIFILFRKRFPNLFQLFHYFSFIFGPLHFKTENVGNLFSETAFCVTNARYILWRRKKSTRVFDNPKRKKNEKNYIKCKIYV